MALGDCFGQTVGSGISALAGGIWGRLRDGTFGRLPDGISAARFVVRTSVRIWPFAVAPLGCGILVRLRGPTNKT